MPRIKINVAGWEAFDGFLGPVEFKGGVSIHDVDPLSIKRIGANIAIVELESNEQIGPAVTMVNTRHVSAHVETPLQKEQEQPETETDAGYTEDQLNQMADAGGIKAIRKIAEPFGVKGVSIQELIKEILEAQKKAK